MSATHIRQTSTAKARKDTMTDSTMHIAARLLGKISQGAINNNNTSTDQEATGNVKKKSNASRKQIDSLDDDDDNSCNENNDGEREGMIDNSMTFQIHCGT